MKKLNALWAKIKLAFVDRIAPSVEGIIAAIDKVEAALELAIAKETRALEVLQQAEEAIHNSKIAKNVEIDKAYKLLHTVGSLTR